MQNFYVRYGGSYLLVYLGLTILVGVITTVLNVDLPSAMSLIMAMVCGYYPAYLFVKDHNRLPEQSEKKKFAIFNLFAITLISCIFMGALMAAIPELSAEIKHLMGVVPAWGLALIFIFVGLIYYIGIYWGFSHGSKMQMKAIEKRAGR